MGAVTGSAYPLQTAIAADFDAAYTRSVVSHCSMQGRIRRVTVRLVQTRCDQAD